VSLPGKDFQEKQVQLTLLAPALIDSNCSKQGAMSFRSIFRKVVPESGVMVSPMISDMDTQCLCRKPLLHSTPIIGTLVCYVINKEKSLK